MSSSGALTPLEGEQLETDLIAAQSLAASAAKNRLEKYNEHMRVDRLKPPTKGSGKANKITAREAYEAADQLHKDAVRRLDAAQHALEAFKISETELAQKLENLRTDEEAAEMKRTEDAEKKRLEDAEKKRREDEAEDKKRTEDTNRRHKEDADKKLAEDAEKKRTEDEVADKKRAEDAEKKRLEDAEKRRREDEAEVKKRTEDVNKRHKEDADKKLAEDADKKLAEDAERRHAAEDEAAGEHMEAHLYPGLNVQLSTLLVYSSHHNVASPTLTALALASGASQEV
ncbi:hypothetical protein DFH09DRAFT_1339395 [Mycena vulgaris]|nr:hypothetical protein DFH09DRAFT_1339395 [Mycena vulgaris]